MSYLWTLSWQGLRQRRRSTALLVTAVAIAGMFLTVVMLVGYSSIRTMRERTRDTYGDQMIVAAGAGEAAQGLLTDPAFPRRGAMYLGGVIRGEELQAPVRVGYIDAAARDMAHIRLKQGVLPASPGEIALEQAAASRLDTAVGETIACSVEQADGTTARRVWTVTGLLENYSATWETMYGGVYNEGDAQEDGLSISPLSGLLAWDEAAALGARPYLYLLDAARADAAAIRAAMPAGVPYCLNYFVYRSLPVNGSDDGGFGDTLLYAGVIAAALLFTMITILLNAFLLSVEKRRRQLALLRGVGATRTQAMGNVLREAALVALIGLPLGILAGIGLSFGAVRLFAAVGGVTLRYAFTGWIPAGVLAVGLLVTLLATCLPAYRAGQVPPVEAVAFRAKRRRPSRWRSRRRMTPLRLMFRSMRHARLKAALTVLGFAFCLFAINYVMLYCSYTSSQEWTTADFAVGPTGDTIGYSGRGLGYDPKPRNPGLPAGISAVLRRTAPVRHVCAEITTPYYLRLPRNPSAYLDNYLRFTRWPSESRADEWEQEAFGYSPEDTYLPVTGMTLLEERTLEELRPYVLEGRLDKEALAAGREVAVCLPDYAYTLKETGNGGSTGQFYVGDRLKDKPESLPVYTNDLFHAGDTIDLTAVELTGETDGKRRDISVKVGAVIGYPPAWASSWLGSSDVLNILLLEGAPEKLGMANMLINIRLFMQDGADLPAAAQQYRQLAGKNNWRVTSYQELLEAERNNRRLLLTVTTMLAVCIAAMGTMGLVNTAAGRIQNRRQELSMLRAVGMTKGQQLRMLVYEGGVYGLLSVALGLGLFFALAGSLVPHALPAVSYGWLFGGAAACLLLAILAVFLPARRVLEVTPMEGIRELD